MKKKVKLCKMIIVIVLCFTGCENKNDNNPMSTQNQFLVDKVYDYKNNLLAETFKNGNLVGGMNYVYYPDGKMKGLIYDNNLEYVIFFCNSTENEEQVKLLGSGNNLPEDGGQTEDRYFDYEYDNLLKQYFGNEPTFAKNISQNNMTKNVESGTKWIYNITSLTFLKQLRLSGIMLKPMNRCFG